MNKTFFIILISVFAFIGINTIFYFNIYNKQLDFQTGLLTLQTQLCGTTIEQEGMNFENGLNYIPFADDISKLFTDDGVRERGAENLQKLYYQYIDLIDKVTVFDNQNHIYSLILDLSNNFVTDYYESQQQPLLREREELFMDGAKYMLSIPDFDESDIVRTNIVVELNFKSFVNSVFEQYLLANTTWPWLVSENGELLATAEKEILVSQNFLDRISSEILEGNEGSLVHSIEVDGLPTRVVTVYYPVRIVKRDLAIAFSMKTDIFLRDIITKIIIITLSSLVLLALLLYLHFRVIRVKSEKNYANRISEESLSAVMDVLPVGFLLAEPDGGIRLMNLAAREFLYKDPSAPYQQQNIRDLDLNDLSGPVDDSIYRQFLGSGEVIKINRGMGDVYLFRREWTTQIGKVDTRIFLLFDITILEKSRKLDNMALLAKKELLTSMKKEIDVPMGHIQDATMKLSGQKLTSSQKKILNTIQKSRDLLSNLVNAFNDFAGQETSRVVLEEIPFSLHTEITMTLDSLKALAGKSNSSIITKIRNDVPDNIVGDPFRLRKVIDTLVETSIELTSNGRILISAEILEQHPDRVKIQFQVEDTGTGLNVKEVEEFLDLPPEEKESIPKTIEKVITRIAVARQNVELMNGQLWLESPSSISTSPDYPGIIFSFTIEVAAKVLPGITFPDVKQFGDIQCLILAQKKDSSETDRFIHFKDLGLNLRYLIYRPDNMGSVTDLVLEKSDSTHFLLLTDSKEEDGFDLAEKLRKSVIGQNLVKIMLSSNPASENQAKCKRLEIDYYIEEPFESHRLSEIISTHFPEIAVQQTKNANISILLAEDNLFNLKVAQALFKSMGYEIDVARNGNEVLSMLDNKNYDIIFMDLLMPEMDGLEAAAAIRKRGHEMPIIALTAVEDDETRENARIAGISDYLVKPTTSENIREILLRIFPKS